MAKKQKSQQPEPDDGPGLNETVDGFEKEPEPAKEEDKAAGLVDGLPFKESAGNEIVTGAPGEVQTADKNHALEPTAGPPDAHFGTLYSIDKGVVTLTKENGRDPGDKFHHHEGEVDELEVTLNGVSTDFLDLKRGDRVILLGDPVHTIEATRF